MGIQQVVVFLDWQNVYKRARQAFHDPINDPHINGQVHPVDLGLTLADRAPAGVERQLAAVRIYRGMPEQSRDPRGYASARRQHTAWERDGRVAVHVCTREIRYPDGWAFDSTVTGSPREKGIDVCLALDFVTMGFDGLYDVGILMSSDQDLVPALEYVHRRSTTRSGKPRIEVAAWRSSQSRSMRLSLGKGKPFCHWLDEETYRGLQDLRDYTRPSPADMIPRSRASVDSIKTLD